MLGIVGKIEAWWRKPNTDIELNKPFTLSLELSGDGNLKSMENPDIRFPDSFEVFETRKNIKYTKFNKSSGKFDFILIPRKVGDFTVPGFKTSYFDPNTAKYSPVESIEINFNQKYINDSFSSIYPESIVMKFNGPGKPVVLRGVGDQSFMYLVMPLNK